MLRDWVTSMSGWVKPAPRESEHTMVQNKPASAERSYRFGDVEVYPHQLRVVAHGEGVSLTEMEVRILSALARRPGVVFTHEQLAEACHDGPVRVEARSVAKRVQVLRKKLGESGSLIVPVPRVGYRLEPAAPSVGWGVVWGWLAWPRRAAAARPRLALGLAGAGMLGVGAAGFTNLELSGTQTVGGVELIGQAHVPAVMIDVDMADKLASGQFTYDMMTGALGSGLDHLAGDRYLAIVDRGPDVEQAGFPSRWHELQIVVTPGRPDAVRVSVVRSTRLADESGRAFTGATREFSSGEPWHDLRFDGESLRVASDGTVWVADEYGPGVYQFNAQGRRRRYLDVPRKFHVDRRHANPSRELSQNTSGRVPNRGFESLAMMPDGGSIVVATQWPLIQDGGEHGRFVRLLELPLSGGLARELALGLEEPGLCVSELLALDDRRLLALERDDQAGRAARVKRLVELDLTGATDISGVESLAGGELPAGARAVRRRVVVDLLDPRLGLTSEAFPRQVEGLTWGPTLPDGRRTLIVGSDSGFEAATAMNSFYVLAVEPGWLEPNASP